MHTKLLVDEGGVFSCLCLQPVRVWHLHRTPWNVRVSLVHYFRVDLVWICHPLTCVSRTWTEFWRMSRIQIAFITAKSHWLHKFDFSYPHWLLLFEFSPLWVLKRHIDCMFDFSPLFPQIICVRRGKVKLVAFYLSKFIQHRGKYSTIDTVRSQLWGNRCLLGIPLQCWHCLMLTRFPEMHWGGMSSWIPRK